MIVFTERMFLLIPFTVFTCCGRAVLLRGSRVSGLGEESGCCKDSGHRGAWPSRIFRGLAAVGVLEVDVADVDDARQAAQPAEEVEQVEVRAVGLNFKRHVVVIFARDDRLRGQAANLHVGSGRCSLHQADEFVFFFFFWNDGLQRLELLRERVHLRFQFAVALAINLKLRDFLIQLRALPDGLVDFVAFLCDR